MAGFIAVMQRNEWLKLLKKKNKYIQEGRARMALPSYS